MLVKDNEKSFLLKEFPNIELSYETVVHKKVYNSNYNFVLAIPDGNKCFIWFTTFKTQNVCVLLEISENKRIHKLSILYACFHQELAYGTVLYGTIFKCKNARYFSAEDIYYYKGNNVSNKTYIDKLKLFHTVFSAEIKQASYFEHNVVFGLPIINTSYEDIIKTVELLPYNVKYIQYRGAKIFTQLYSKTALQQQQQHQQQSFHQKPSFRNDFKREIICKVKPDIQNDIYYLHYYDNNTTNNVFDVAYIPDYKTSVMMNKLFRNIKENANLDALEESDDEEEFENDKPDKFVFLERAYNMVCVWNAKFRKWAPVRLAPRGEKIITKQELPSI
jgi:hypothetical protein